MTIKEIAKKLENIILEAGKIIVSAHNSDKENTTKEKSGSADFVTAYDVAVQERLLSDIKSLLPEAEFIAEEKENDSAVLQSKYCFIIDPIDGTKNFINDYHHSAISVAMLSGGETVFAAIYDPYMDELFTAVKGEGAYVNGREMHVSSREFEKGIAAIGSSPYYKDILADATLALTKKIFLTASDFRRTGSAALDLAYLAAGRNDLFFELRLSPWDIAAGALLIKEAGGIITDKNGKEISYAGKSSVFAGTEHTHARLLALAHEVM